AELLRAGLVHEAGLKHSGSRPAVVYEFAPRAESALSRAYIPFVGHLLRALGERMSSKELDKLMRSTGQALASEWPPLRGDLKTRVGAASALLEELGALTDVTPAGKGFLIRGHGCLLAEAVHGRPEVCRAVESLLSHLVDAP